MSDLIIPVGIPVVRDRGCFNCVHFREHASEETQKRLTDVFQKTYDNLRDQGLDKWRAGAACSNGIRELARAKAGLCTVPGGPSRDGFAIEADFQAEMAICDRWTGRTHVHAPLDKQPDELRDLLGLPQAEPPAPVVINPDPPAGENGDGGASA